MSRVVVFIYFVALIFLVGTDVSAANKCARIFVKFVVTKETQRHINATIKDLAKFRVSLDVAKTHGTNFIEHSAMSAHFIQKEKDFVAYLEDHGIMTRAELLLKIKSQIAEVQESVKKDIEKIEKENKRIKKQLVEMENTITDGTRMVFHPLQPGKFKMGVPGEQVDVHLTRKFEMMATPTTQILWARVVELAKDRFGDSHIMKLKPHPSERTGDTLPVETVSYYTVQSWIEALNRLSQEDDFGLHMLIRDFKKGDVFRLPTEAEWEFVATGGRKRQETPHVIDWTKENSQGQTQSVAQNLPILVEGERFYDMNGNVREFVADAFEDVLPGGKNPLVESVGGLYTARGGSWFTPVAEGRLYERFAFSPFLSSGDIGFRLVREVKP